MLLLLFETRTLEGSDRHTTAFRAYIKRKRTESNNKEFSRIQQGETWGTRGGEDNEKNSVASTLYYDVLFR